MDCSPPSSSVHGISPARILEWVAIIFSRGSSRPRDQTHISCTSRWILYHWATGKPTWYLLNMSKEHKCPWACYLSNISIYFFPQVKEKLEHFLLQDFPLTWNLGPKLCFHFFLNDVGVLLLFFSVLLLLAWFCNYLGIAPVVLEKTLETPLYSKETQPVHPKGNQSWVFIGRTDAEFTWNSNTLATWCEELTHLKRPWCWERLKAGGEGDNRGWDG